MRVALRGLRGELGSQTAGSQRGSLPANCVIVGKLLLPAMPHPLPHNMRIMINPLHEINVRIQLVTTWKVLRTVPGEM